MKDVQSNIDYRNLPIDQVGIRKLKYPITVKDRRSGAQKTIASIDMSVELPRRFKGTHMSRFVEALNDHQGIIDIRSFGRILQTLKDRLEARSAHLSLTFPYFVEKMAPVSGEKGLMEYECCYEGKSGEDGSIDYLIGVTVPVTSLCPCSKEISERGAHNQRSYVTIKARFAKTRFVWIEDLVKIAEECASADVYSLLKRADEKFLTEKAYDNPRFVEDMVREIAARLMQMPEIRWFRVESEHMESIHNHNAFALIEIDKAAQGR